MESGQGEAENEMPGGGMMAMTKWKPRTDNIVRMPSLDRIGVTIGTETQSRHIYLWLPTPEAEEFAKAVLEAVDENKRIAGIRNAEHAMRWV